MTTRTITAIYDSETDARQARERLARVGLDEDDVRIVSQNLTSSSVSSDASGSEDKGMWESIKDFFVGDDDRPTYSEGLRRGGYLLTARVDDSRTDEAIAELEQTNAIDLDERSQQWRAEGWTGTAAMSSSMARADGSMANSSTLGTSQSLSRETMDTTRGARASTDEQAIPVVEERLRVGKREVDRGGVRVRSYIVEEPVREEVSLREEHVEVERRPVSDATARTGEGLLQERSIELSERGEEAVVAKDAVVTEEVVVRKTADERVETIDETVRRTEVDIDDSRTESGVGTRGTSSSTRTGSTKSKR